MMVGELKLGAPGTPSVDAALQSVRCGEERSEVSTHLMEHHCSRFYFRHEHQRPFCAVEATFYFDVHLDVRTYGRVQLNRPGPCYGRFCVGHVEALPHDAVGLLVSAVLRTQDGVRLEYSVAGWHKLYLHVHRPIREADCELWAVEIHEDVAADS